MMTFYQMIALLAVVLVLFQISVLTKTKKHDHVLYRICQIRREAMAILRNRGTQLRHDDYGELRLMIEAMNAAIENYKDYKTIIFDWRSMRNYLENYKTSTRDITNYDPSDREILAIRNSLVVAIMHGFLAYTPLVSWLGIEWRSVFVRRTVGQIAAFLTSIRVIRQSTVELVKEAMLQIDKDVRKFGVNSCHATNSSR